MSIEILLLIGMAVLVATALFIAVSVSVAWIKNFIEKKHKEKKVSNVDIFNINHKIFQDCDNKKCLKTIENAKEAGYDFVAVSIKNGQPEDMTFIDDISSKKDEQFYQMMENGDGELIIDVE